MTDFTPHTDRLAKARLADLATIPASLEAAGWRIDSSRQRLDPDARAALDAFAASAGLEAGIAELFSGAEVNPSEARAALHWALRAQAPLTGDAETVRTSLEAADAFAERVCAPESPFKSIVHIGIGGSDFGPRLLADAFHLERDPRFELRFCANLDPVDLELALQGLDPASTLVVGVSKSFGTEETLYNLARARNWLEAALGPSHTGHLAVVTANPDRARTWLGEGADAARFLDLPETVGGRFSIWSAGSVACAIALGLETVRAFRAGAAAMDDHVRTAPLAENAAVQLALLDYWNRSVLGAPMRVMGAYARRLRMLPAYLQQLEMESNGKSVGPDGEPVEAATAPALWGGEGTIGQHSYHQWLHQGTDAVPVEFLLAFDKSADAAGQTALAAHALAQAEVLANGRDLAAVEAEEPGLAEAVARQKVHAGERPSTFLFHPDFGPHALGALIALYEHRTFLAGRLWGLNPFDQWGVERGKTMAGRINSALTRNMTLDDPATARLAAPLRRTS